MLDLSISLISYNQRHNLEQLLPSLVTAAGWVNSEILLVDNRSQDNTSAFIRQEFPNLRIISNPNKTGYGENHNLNLQKALGKYIVIMNSDMVVIENIFLRLKTSWTNMWT